MKFSFLIVCLMISIRKSVSLNIIRLPYISQISTRISFRQLGSNNSPSLSITLNEKDIQESFVRGSGPGGQKINKSKNNVHLVHEPTGISVQCQEHRDLATNRKIARKLLKDKIDLAQNGDNSKLGKRFQKIRKQKANAARKAKKKYPSHISNKDENTTVVKEEEEEEYVIEEVYTDTGT